MSEQCAHPRCRKPAGIWLGLGDGGEDGWVCEKHIQYCSINEDGVWCLHRYIADARAAQAEELDWCA